jgi:hypothetical protein
MEAFVARHVLVKLLQWADMDETVGPNGETVPEVKPLVSGIGKWSHEFTLPRGSGFDRQRFRSRCYLQQDRVKLWLLDWSRHTW